MANKDPKAARQRRKYTIRAKVSGTQVRPRLTVFRSNKHIYAQVIDDEAGHTLAFATSQKGIEGDKLTQARTVGQLIAKACLDKGIDKVVFDRNGYVFRSSGEGESEAKPTRIAALAEAAREAGLSF